MPFSIRPFLLLSCCLPRVSARRLIALGVISLVLGHEGIGLAVVCPPPPEQTGKDYEAKVDVEVAKIGRIYGPTATGKIKTVTQDLLGKLPDAGRVYLGQMMYSTRCTSIRDNKSVSNTEKDKQIGELNAWFTTYIGPQTPQSPASTSVPPPSKQSDKQKRISAGPPVSPAVTPHPQAEMKCGEQSTNGLMRKPRSFVPTWRGLLGQIRFENDETDVASLVKRGSRVRWESGEYARPENLIREAIFSVNCVEKEGWLRLEPLGPSTYENVPYENQRIVFIHR